MAMTPEKNLIPQNVELNDEALDNVSGGDGIPILLIPERNTNGVTPDHRRINCACGTQYEVHIDERFPRCPNCGTRHH